jgi:hypothetical protein
MYESLNCSEVKGRQRLSVNLSEINCAEGQRQRGGFTDDNVGGIDGRRERFLRRLDHSSAK